MANAPLIDANGAKIPAIGLGTWQLRGQAAADAVRAAIEAGYRHIDTAEMYGNEADVGAGLQASGIPRDEVFVTTKVWWENLAGDALLRSAEASLKKLAMDQVDLLLIHWPNPDGKVESWIEALCEAKQRGLARHIGVSNFPVALLDRALASSTEPLCVNQCEYHPALDQAILIEACHRHGLAFTSYCPLGRGNTFCADAIGRIAAAHGKTPAQIVLRWHVQQPGVVAIPKSGTASRIAENIGIFDFALEPDEMDDISALRRPGSRVVDPDFAPVWDVQPDRAQKMREKIA